MGSEGVPDDGDASARQEPVRVVTRRIEPDREHAEEQLVEIVADIAGTSHDQLPPLYTCIDDMVGKLFDDPPPEEADAVIAFAYAGYWIQLDQSGEVVIQERSD